MMHHYIFNVEQRSEQAKQVVVYWSVLVSRM